MVEVARLNLVLDAKEAKQGASDFKKSADNVRLGARGVTKAMNDTVLAASKSGSSFRQLLGAARSLRGGITTLATSMGLDPFIQLIERSKQLEA